MNKIKKKKNLVDIIKEMKPNPELADAVEKAYKQRKHFKFKDVKW